MLSRLPRLAWDELALSTKVIMLMNAMWWFFADISGVWFSKNGIGWRTGSFIIWR